MDNRQAIIISGGVAHDFAATSPRLAEVLTQAGFGCTISEDPEGALRGLGQGVGAEAEAGARAARPLVVLNMLRWLMEVERYAHLREQWALSLSAQARAALTDHVRSGGGLLAMHGASICFDDWPEWKDLLGGVWDWEQSSHPPVDGEVRVTISPVPHPITAGLGDFDIIDEVYGFLSLAPDVQGLLHSPHGGTDHPLLWAREVGQGRVVYDALGHDERSFAVPEHVRIVQRAALWASGVDDLTTMDAVAHGG